MPKETSSLMPKLYLIHEILRERGIMLKDFAQALGMSPNGVKQMIKRNSTKIQTLEQIADVLHYPVEYFLHGTNRSEPQHVATKQIPHIPYSAQAGSLSGFSESAVAQTCLFFPRIDLIGSYDFTIDIQGDSMIPIYQNGDTIACKRICSIQDLHNGMVYVLDTAQGILVKEVWREAPEARNITCISSNKLYPPLSIDLTEVFGISEVVAILKRP